MDRLSGTIETCASRKVDKEDTKPVRIAVYYLARRMQALGMPRLLLLGMSSTANWGCRWRLKLAARDIEGSACSRGTPSVASSRSR